MVDFLSLPPELLINIFKLATDNPIRAIESLASWSRFEPLYATNAEKGCKDTIRTKSALARVCRSFKRLTSELLYEEIWIRHGSVGLLEALESSKGEFQDGLGSFVKRVSLALVSDGGSGGRQSQRPSLETARQILLLCPNVRIISRPQEAAPAEDDQDQVLDCLPLDDLDFPHLHRVLWHNTLFDLPFASAFDLPFASAPSPRFIWNSSSLRVLIVGADNFPDRADDIDPETVVNLPNVHTLGIRSLNTFGNELRRYSFHLPALRRLVVGRPEAIYNFFSGCLTPLSPQITAIELEPEPRFLRHDFIATLLGYCSNVTELCIPLATTHPMNRNEMPRVILDFPIRQVFLHAAFPSPPAEHFYKDVPWWTLLHEHFEGLCGTNSRLNVLERIVLCGEEWRHSVEDSRFADLVRLVRVKGVEIECEDTLLQHAIASHQQDL